MGLFHSAKYLKNGSFQTEWVAVFTRNGGNLFPEWVAGLELILQLFCFCC